MARLAAKAAFCTLVVGLAGAERLTAASRHRPARRGRRRLAPLLLLGARRAAAQAPLSFWTLDEDGDGVVNKMEFMLATRDMLDASNEEKSVRNLVYSHAESLYVTCDVDGDGVLDETELAYARYLATAAVHVAEREGRSFAAYDFEEDGSGDMLRDCDLDGDGWVNEHEFEVNARLDLELWGWEPKHFDVPSVREWLHGRFLKADLNADGLLDARELQFACFLVRAHRSAVLSRRVLQTLDRNLDGKFGFGELTAVVMESRGRPPSLRKSLLDHIVADFWPSDLDGDGALDLVELQELFTRCLVFEFVRD